MIAIETNAPNEGPAQELTLVPSDRFERLVVRHLPEDVERFYVDAMVVMQAGVPDGAAVQLRRTLEAAMAHVGIKAFPLMNAVKELIDQGLVTKQFGAVLDHVRLLGNIGAHATDDRLSDEQVQRALDFTTQVLRNLFEIPAQLASLGEGDSE